MTFDIPHMIATGVILLAVILLFDHTKVFESMTKGRRTFLKLLVVFVLIVILNLVWPYGATA